MIRLFLYIILGVILSSCASIYDAANPDAEIRRRSFIINTYNYQDLTYVGEKGSVKLDQYMDEVNTANIDVNGKLIGADNNEEVLNIEDEFGEFSSYLTGDKIAVATLSVNRELMKGWKNKIPFEVRAINHQPETIYLKKKLRLGLFLGDLYPFLGLGLPFENGHLWKLRKEYFLEMEPTKNYSDYLTKLADFNKTLHKQLSDLSTTAIPLSVDKAWIIKENEGVYSIINLASADILPKPSGEISQRDILFLDKSIKLLEEESLYKSQARAQIRINELIAQKEKENYKVFMNQEVVCSDNNIRKKLIDTWFVDYSEETIAVKAVKDIMTLNLHWIPNEVFSIEISAQNKIIQINEDKTKDEEQKLKEYESYLNEIITCNDGRQVKRENICCWIMQEEKYIELEDMIEEMDNYMKIDIFEMEDKLEHWRGFFIRNKGKLIKIKKFSDYNITIDNYRDKPMCDAPFTSEKSAIKSAKLDLKNLEDVMLKEIDEIEDHVTKIAQDYIDALEQQNNQPTYNSTPNYNNSNSNKRTCYKCKGSGKCRECTKPQKVRTWNGASGWKNHTEIRLGRISCSTCQGNGRVGETAYGSYNSGKACHISDCNSGFRACRECQYGTPGQCKSCKGTGSD